MPDVKVGTSLQGLPWRDEGDFAGVFFPLFLIADVRMWRTMKKSNVGAGGSHHIGAPKEARPERGGEGSAGSYAQ